MKELTIDGKYMKSKEAMYVHLTRVFSLPSYFGNNLDALWDILTESEESTKINFLNVDLTRKYLGDYGERLIGLLEKLAEYDNYTITFI